MDIVSKEQRSKIMSRIRSQGTRPEMAVRRYLWRLGYRYRLCVRRLPGRPDIVIRRLKVAIFVNGCFWHGHSHMKRMPEANAAYWSAKIEANKQRDVENGIKLRQMGWTVITIWECELAARRRQATLERLGETLRMLEQSPYTRSDAADLSVAAEPPADYFPS